MLLQIPSSISEAYFSEGKGKGIDEKGMKRGKGTAGERERRKGANNPIEDSYISADFLLPC